MKRVTVIVCLFTLISCQDKVICPAYQSTFILDDNTRDAYFSYAWQLDETSRSQYLGQTKGGDSTSVDSTTAIAQPEVDYYAYAGEYNVPWRVPKKTKFGIIKPVFYPIKKYRMRTAPMENVLAPDPISNEFTDEEFGLDSLQADSVNRVATDSVGTSAVVAKQEAAPASDEDEVRFLYGYDPEDNFNVEQLYYNKYFAERLIDHRPRPEPVTNPVDSLNANDPADSLSTKKTPFFKGLFKKKDRSAAEEAVEAAPIQEPEITPTTEQEEEQQPEGDGGR